MSLIQCTELLVVNKFPTIGTVDNVVPHSLKNSTGNDSMGWYDECCKHCASSHVGIGRYFAPSGDGIDDPCCWQRYYFCATGYFSWNPECSGISYDPTCE
eukprot:m.502639 g.502639  ORF g.502639 m.502639 type:complete len:100 (+) comp21843_c0_seq12:159-458(+)